MLLDKTIEIITTGKNISYYKKIGYECGYRTKINVKQQDLPKSSNKIVEVMCDYCGDIFSSKYQDLNRETIINKHCCSKCIYRKIEESCMEKYGVKSYLETDESKEKRIEYSMKTYGVDCLFKSDEIKNKIKNTNIERYGVENVFESDEIKNKIKTKLLSKYGVDNPLKSKEIKYRVQNTCLEKYGAISPLGNKEIRDKCINSNNQKYGVDYPLQNETIKEKQKNTMTTLYGSDNPCKIEEFKTRAIGKMKKTNLEKYGFECASKNKVVSEKIRKSVFLSLADSKNVPSSKNQRYLCDLYNGELNKPMSYYFLDIYFKQLNVYCEYDGSGHDLNVKLGNITKEDFLKKEIIRYKTLKNKGLKLFRIIHSAKNLPNDEIMLYIKDLALQLLSATDNNWIVFDIDKNTIKLKNKTIFYDYKSCNIKIEI